jgi:hypothetical protein
VRWRLGGGRVRAVVAWVRVPPPALLQHTRRASSHPDAFFGIPGFPSAPGATKVGACCVGLRGCVVGANTVAHHATDAPRGCTILASTVAQHM